VTGLSLQLTGLLAISRVSVDSTYLGSLFLPIVVLGVGAGLTFTPLVTLIMGTMAPEDAGAASGLLQTAQQVGGAMGLGILTTVFGTVTRTGTAVEGISTALTVGASFTVLALVAVIVFAGRPARSGIAPAAPVVSAAEHP
jgi:sugar phosphate permease